MEKVFFNLTLDVTVEWAEQVEGHSLGMFGHNCAVDLKNLHNPGKIKGFLNITK